MMHEIPHAIWEGTFTINGIELRCATLSNGQRVINTEDVERLFETIVDSSTDIEQLEAFARWQRGG